MKRVSLLAAMSAWSCRGFAHSCIRTDLRRFDAPNAGTTDYLVRFHRYQFLRCYYRLYSRRVRRYPGLYAHQWRYRDLRGADAGTDSSSAHGRGASMRREPSRAIMPTASMYITPSFEQPTASFRV